MDSSFRLLNIYVENAFLPLFVIFTFIFRSFIQRRLVNTTTTTIILINFQMMLYHGQGLLHHNNSTSALNTTFGSMALRFANMENPWKDIAATAACESSPTKLSEAGSGLLYNLLTSTDARSVQRSSAFYGELTGGEPPAQLFPRRSNSLTFRRAEQSPSTSGDSYEPRPSSAPHEAQRYQQCSSNLSHNKLTSSAHINFKSNSELEAGTHRSEPLDLCVRGDCSDSESVSSGSSDTHSSVVQPMLRTILQHGSIFSTSPSLSTDSTSSCGSPPCSMHLADDVVQLSRKQAHVVRARVACWLKEAVDFAVEKPVFVTLPVEVQLALLRRAWPRLLLLSMAEHGCSFAVTACEKNDVFSHFKSAPATSSGVRQPTRTFADSLLRIIELAHCLGLDETAFNLLRLAAILKGESEAEVSLSQVHSEILAYLHSHLKSIDRAEYFADVVRLLAVLSDIDKHMIESLLCGQMPNGRVDAYLDERFATR